MNPKWASEWWQRLRHDPRTDKSKPHLNLCHKCFAPNGEMHCETIGTKFKYKSAWIEEA